MKNKAAIFTLSVLTAIASFLLINFAFSWNACTSIGATFHPSQFACLDSDLRQHILVAGMTYMAVFALISLVIGVALGWLLSRARRHA